MTEGGILHLAAYCHEHNAEAVKCTQRWSARVSKVCVCVCVCDDLHQLMARRGRLSLA